MILNKILGELSGRSLHSLTVATILLGEKLNLSYLEYLCVCGYRKLNGTNAANRTLDITTDIDGQVVFSKFKLLHPNLTILVTKK